jgi:Glycosyltransferase family 87
MPARDADDLLMDTAVPGTPRLRNLGSAALTAALVVGAAGMLVVAIGSTFGSHGYSDFGVFWHAAGAVLHGRSPYPPATVHALRHQNAFVYPAPAALAIAPLGLLPEALAAALFLALSIAAVVGSLLLLGVRDVRCHAVALLSLTTVQGLALGAVSPLLVLPLAVAWRWRDRLGVVAATAAFAVAMKLFLAPMGIWLAVTRRGRSAVIAGFATALVVLGTWPILGLSTLRTYPHLLSTLTRVEGRSGLSAYALAVRAGLPASAAEATVIVLVAALALLAFRLRRAAGADAAVFAIAVTACLVASPIVWLHYYALLLVPIAILSPRLSWAWALPLASWLFAEPVQPAATWKIVLAQLVLAGVAALALRHTAAQPAGATERSGAGAPSPAA